MIKLIGATTSLTAAAILLATPAFAHVVLEPSEGSSGASYRAVFKVSHGCDGSPTVKLRLQIPAGVIGVKPMVKPGWQIETQSAKYDRSYNFYHGATQSEGVKEVTWSGKLEDKFYDEFVVSMFLSDALPGNAPVYFPVEQECEKGVLNWSEIPQAGGNPHDLKEPAPFLMIKTKTAATTAPGVQVTEAWSRATPGGAQVGAGYLTIVNNTANADRLVAVSSPKAGKVEIHEMAETNGVMTMRQVSGGLPVEAGKTVQLAPGSLHLMLMDLKAPLKQGDKVPLTLEFERAGKIDATLDVQAIGAAKPAAAGGHVH